MGSPSAWMKEQTILPKGLIQLLMLTVAMGAAVQGVGCATPEQRHRLLTFFFDGVPPLHPEEPEAMPGGPADGEERQPIQVRPKASDASVHGPVEKRNCGGCHAADQSNRLKAKKEELCWNCHEEEDFVGEFVHGPVASGYCVGCHDPHRSDYAFLLRRAPEDLCEHCHNEFTFKSLTDHRIERGDDCRSCHDPHAANRKFMLKIDEESP